jgi:hypothetical protein
LEVPPGHGEYKDKDHPENGTDGPGDDELKNAQEVVRDKYLMSVVHAYALPDSYPISITIDVAWDASGLVVTASRVHTDKAPRWKKDGGDLPLLGTLIGSIFAPGIGTIIGYDLGSKGESWLRVRLDSEIAKKISGYSKSWHL